jgi:2-keto-4-pentenoate hydratase/2-oxohepta-3-ene-1,7-dioic acid hydratase in catechol pathway
MRLARVTFDDARLPAVEVKGHWVAASALDTRFDSATAALVDLQGLGATVEDVDIESIVAAGGAVPCDGASLAAPLDPPGKILAIGLNYLDHIREVGATPPAWPLMFAKFPTSMVGPYDDVVIDPRLTGQGDYEVELAVVIGRRARDVAEGDALDAVAGYAVANDVSARDVQHSESQWTRSKSFDGFCPVGPWVTTADEVPDPQRLALRSVVNGDVRQSSNTDQMLFGVAELVSFLSRGTTLEPGDLILTGTPPGVALGMPGQPWLQPGDVVRCEVEGLGHIENRIVGPSA